MDIWSCFRQESNPVKLKDWQWFLHFTQSQQLSPFYKQPADLVQLSGSNQWVCQKKHQASPAAAMGGKKRKREEPDEGSGHGEEEAAGQPKTGPGHSGWGSVACVYENKGPKCSSQIVGFKKDPNTVPLISLTAMC